MQQLKSNETTDSVYYVDNYAIITDKRLESARTIDDVRKESYGLKINMTTVYEVLSNYHGFLSIEEAIQKAKERKWCRGVNIIAISQNDFDDNGFVVARVERDGSVDTLEDLDLEDPS